MPAVVWPQRWANGTDALNQGIFLTASQTAFAKKLEAEMLRLRITRKSPCSSSCKAFVYLCTCHLSNSISYTANTCT